MSTNIVWGVVNKDGTINSSGGGFSITHEGEGEYIISFSPEFSATPAITGSQVLYESQGQWPTDGVVFPYLNKGAATAITGGGTDGNRSDRSFSFIAIGPA